MQNFEYYTPTRVVFGKNTESEVGRLAANAGSKKVLIHYGGGSCVRSGLLDRVKASLSAAGIAFAELGGVVPNPRLSLVRTGIELCKNEGVDLVLAVGGGSVIDSAKAIAYGLCYAGDVWDLFDGKAVPAACAPVGVVLTIAAAGSEMSNSCVITNEQGDLKRGVKSEYCRPRFAVLNPELTMTLPAWQTASGCVDIVMHTMERYFTTEKGASLSTALAEALMRDVMTNARVLAADPTNYTARANIMWAGSLSHNGLTGCGQIEDWGCHQIEHELSGMFDCTHGAGLAAVWGSWARHVRDADVARFARFATNVMGVPAGSDLDAVALAGIAAVENWFRSIKMPTSLAELGCVPTEAQIDELAEKCVFFGRRTIGKFKVLDKKDIIKIYYAAL